MAIKNVVATAQDLVLDARLAGWETKNKVQDRIVCFVETKKLQHEIAKLNRKALRERKRDARIAYLEFLKEAANEQI